MRLMRLQIRSLNTVAPPGISKPFITGINEIDDIASAHAGQINTFYQGVLQSLSGLSPALRSAGTDKWYAIPLEIPPAVTWCGPRI